MVRAIYSSQVNSAGSQLGTQSQADSTVSQAVNNSFEVGSTTIQQGMNVGSAGAQTQAGSTFCQAVSFSQADNTPSQVGSVSPQPGRYADNAGAQSQADSTSPQASRVSSLQTGTL